MLFTSTLSPPTPAVYLRAVIDGLRVIVGTYLARFRIAPPQAPLLVLVWGYLGRAGRRMEWLQARWRAGQLKPAPPRAAGPASPITTSSRPARIRFPRGAGWLIRLVQPTAQYTGHIHALLADPEMAALLADAPQAGRILRPLCRMLGLVPFPGALRPLAKTLPPSAVRPAALPPPAPMPASLLANVANTVEPPPNTAKHPNAILPANPNEPNCNHLVTI